jgi:hypothetical protein
MARILLVLLMLIPGMQALGRGPTGTSISGWETGE